jgi:hypothetical protein
MSWDDVEMMTGDYERDALAHTCLRTPRPVAELHYWSTSWLQRRQVTPQPRTLGASVNPVPARDGNRLAFRTQVSLGWRGREDLLPTLQVREPEAKESQVYTASRRDACMLKPGAMRPWTAVLTLTLEPVDLCKIQGG